MPDGTDNRLRKGRKYDEVIAGARNVFLRDGFDGATVDDIAREAGVSKATLYSYFPDKHRLFLEVASGEILNQAEAAMDAIDMTAPVADVLCQVGHRIIDVLTSDFGQRIFRTFVAESERFPELGRGFYETGPALARARLGAYLEEAVERGELVVDDIALAADQFHMLCKVDFFDRIIFCNASEISIKDRNRVIDGAVATFIARFGAKS